MEWIGVNVKYSVRRNKDSYLTQCNTYQPRMKLFYFIEFIHMSHLKPFGCAKGVSAKISKLAKSFRNFDILANFNILANFEDLAVSPFVS